MLRRVLAGFRALHPRPRRRRAPTAANGGGKARVTVRRLSSNGRKDATPAANTTEERIHEEPVTIRVATFNAAMFSMAPAISEETYSTRRNTTTTTRKPKGILKAQATLSRSSSKARVSINIQDNEMSKKTTSISVARKGRSVEEVLREVGADIIGLQNVRAEEGMGMRPLSSLAEGLGMRYVFAESWAPEYGNAVLSRWPIKRWKSLRLADPSDFRNVLRATIEVPRAGEVNFHCTHLDHLDESWRMKQMNAILRSSDGPHILAGGLNALDGTDYSDERWTDIVKYYEEIGKPTPKVEVMKYLKGKQYVDAKDFAGECEAVVVVAKGQDVQGTCKYGTRVDYIMASPNSPYKFVPGSYTVISSKGTSDHHIVKVDVTIQDMKGIDEESCNQRQRVVKINKKSSRKGLWVAK